MAQNSSNDTNENWKTRTYLMGTLAGAAFGLISAYLFARAAEENEGGKPESISTGTLLSLVLAVMGLLRQIAESGKSKKK